MGCFMTIQVAQAQLPAESRLFNEGWSFHKGDFSSTALAEQQSDSAWEPVMLPHDWSIRSGFSNDWGSATGYLPGGIGWYRKRFNLQEGKSALNHYIYFGGVYKHSKVWLNGHKLGERPSGFSSFFYNLTPYLNPHGENELLVRVDHTDFADSRWYTGSGIYRDVYLTSVPSVHIPIWGVSVSTTSVIESKAMIHLQISVDNASKESSVVQIENALVNAEGITVATSHQKAIVASGGSILSDTTLSLIRPNLWSVDRPYLYTLETRLKSKGKILNVFKTPVGIRELRYTSDSGLFLNGENIKLKGVCVHDDAGCFGTAVPMAVWRERLSLLKSAGCNAIRMSHNPHATGLYALCDQMGFLVIDEAFDEWELGKHKWITGWNDGTPGTDGYHSDFKKWWKRDLGDMIKRDRNHPSIIMWSIGNEIDYPNDPYSDKVLSEGHYPQIYGSGFMDSHPGATALGRISRELATYTRSIDAARPVTAALAAVMVSDKVGYTDNLDVAGYNYQEYRYEKDHNDFPNRVIYGSENGHGYNAWLAVVEHPYIMGQFLWTGIDYLGEASKWPSHGNEAGLIDLAGFKKPEYYFRQSLWSEKPMIYIGTSKPFKRLNLRNGRHGMARPVWNYEKGDSVNVYCYTNCEKATLFLNNTSLGTSYQNDSTHVIMWRVAYLPGKLTVRAQKDGREVADEISTHGKVDHISAQSHVLEGLPGEKKMYAVDLQIADSSGIPVPVDSIQLSIKVLGGGRLIGLENGNISDSETYGRDKRQTYQGRLRAYVEPVVPGQRIKVVVCSATEQHSTIKALEFEING